MSFFNFCLYNPYCRSLFKRLGYGLYVCLFFLVSTCAKQKQDTENAFKVGYSSNLLSQLDRNTLKDIFQEKGLSHISLFFEELDKFNSCYTKDTNMSDWIKTDKLIYNEVACVNEYDKHFTGFDGNCRLTTYLLMHDLIHIQKPKTEHGNYLMFDIDVLETNPEYATLLPYKDYFVTLFDEISVTDTDNIDRLFSDKWNECGMNIKSDDVSIISLVIYDEYEKVVFVGHTGILIDMKDFYIFVEKIAFKMPYQMSIFSSKQELIDMFSKRSEYFSNDEQEVGPYIYENEILLHTF